MGIVTGKEEQIMEKSNILFKFERGAFFGGFLKILIRALLDDPDNVSVEVNPKNGFRYIYHMKDQEFIMPAAEMARIESFLKTILYWKEKYYTREDILDGYGWGIEYHCRGFDFESDGYESYPEDYRAKMTELQTIIEDLCQEYNPDGYEPSGRQLRIEL